MAVCGRAAAFVVHRETQHIVSGVQAYARQARGVKKSAASKRSNYSIDIQGITQFT
jgi:hypothetical protein